MNILTLALSHMTSVQEPVVGRKGCYRQLSFRYSTYGASNFRVVLSEWNGQLPTSRLRDSAANPRWIPHQALGAHGLAKDAQHGGPASSAEPRPRPGTINGAALRAEDGRSDAVPANGVVEAAAPAAKVARRRGPSGTAV